MSKRIVEKSTHRRSQKPWNDGGDQSWRQPKDQKNSTQFPNTLTKGLKPEIRERGHQMQIDSLHDARVAITEGSQLERKASAAQ